MSYKKSKKPLRPLAKHLLFGIPTNIAVGPLGFRAELGVNPQDEKNPDPPRIVFHKRESEVQGPPVPGASTAVAIPDIELNDHPTRENIDQTRHEDGPEVVLDILEQDNRSTALVAPAVFPDVAAETGFGPLKALLRSISATCADRQGTVGVRNKIEVLLPHVTPLDVLFATPPNDVEDQRSRDELIREVERVEGKLRLLHKKPGLQKVVGHVQGDEVMLGRLEDLQEAIFRYQVVRRATINDQELKPMDQVETAFLNSFRCAHQAEYRHGDRNGCLKGTRSAVLDEIELWTHDPHKPPVYWLNGLAGTGKTTIAQTIAENTFSAGRLGASFFCSRDFEDRRNLKFIFPTLAVQLARTYAKFRSVFVPMVNSDPEIVHESLYGQMNKLIVQPLVKSAISTVIVIDALDECRDKEPSSTILSVLRQFVAKIPKVKFFVTGRPEPHIREGFRLLLLAEATDVFVLHEVEPTRVNNDLRLFFGHNFSELKRRRRVLGNWPTEDQLNLLCERSAGVFIYAVATVRFIDQKTKNPKRQLDRILQAPESGLEGRTELRENVTLDSLYMSILQEAFSTDDPGGGPDIRSVLGAVILATNPLSPSTIAALLGFDVDDVYPILSSVHSLLVLQEDIGRPVRPFHKSFHDFIVDPTRCTDPRFLIRSSDHHAELLVGCFKLMNRQLEQNMCKLPDGVVNAEVDDLKERTERYIGKALEYACKSWHKHLVDRLPAGTIEVLHRFLEKKLLFWLEVLSLIGAARDAVDALEVTAKWLDSSPTLDLARDYSRFVITFFDLINTSASHIYISALPLSPKTSMIHETYEKYARPLARVVHGLQTTWEPVVATIYSEHVCGATGWSPCNKFIAVARPRLIEIRDAATLNLLTSLECPSNRALQWLHFSPDGRLLTGYDSTDLITWDLQTGGSVTTSFPEGLSARHLDFSSTHCMGRGILAAVYLDRTHKNAFVVTHDLSATRTHVYRVPEGRIIPSIWAHDEFLRFVTVKQGYITIWEAELTLTQTPEVVELLPAPDEITDIGTRRELLFLPMLSRLAIALRNTLLVWSARDSKFLLKVSPSHSVGMSFSSDGRFFACLLEHTREVHVWKESLVGYILHQKLAFPAFGNVAVPLLSPNGESIVIPLFSSIHLWHTKDRVTSSSPTVVVSQRKFLLDISTSGESAGFVRCGRDTVIIIDLQSGNPRLTIDTEMGVECLGMNGSTIVAACKKKIVVWDLVAGNARVGIKDSARITMFGSPPSRPKRQIFSMLVSPNHTHVAMVGVEEKTVSPCLDLYDAFSTGRWLAATETRGVDVYFAPDGCGIWCGGQGWGIIEDGKSGDTELQPLGANNSCPPGTFPWQSSRGYRVTDDGWILSPTQLRLLSL